MKFSHYFGYVVGLVGSVASVASLMLCNMDCITNVVFHNSIYIFGLLICLVTIFFILQKHYKFKKYYDAYPILNSAFKSLHTILNPDVHIGTSLVEDLMVLQKFCSSLKETFDEISEHDTAICIKLLRNNNNRPNLFNLIRDVASTGKRKTGDKDEAEGKVHYLENNSDFNYIFDSSQNQELNNKYFLCNDLCTKEYYRNSRINYHEFPPKTKWFQSKDYVRTKHWPLLYKSSLVVPIIPLDENRIGTHKLEGFLCLDSNKKNSFSERDVDIMRGLADALYAPMRALREKHFP